MDTCPEIETTLAQLQSGQQKDILLSKVRKCKTDGLIPDKNIYSTGSELKKYETIATIAD